LRSLLGREQVIDVTVTSPPYWNVKDYGTKGQIGYGQSLDQYLADLTAIFTEVWHCTRKTGSLWIVINTIKKDNNLHLLPFKNEPITAESDPEQRLVEMHQRHLINYVPGKGYVELCSPNQAKTLQDELASNVIADQARSLCDDYLQLEARAFLRLRLCLQLIAEIDKQNGVYHLHHAQITERRRSWLEQYECPNHLSRHIEPILV